VTISVQFVPSVRRTDLAATKRRSSGRWLPPAVLAAFGVIAIVVSRWIYAVPPAARTFASLSALAFALIVGGFIVLMVLVPAAGSNPEVKTEFHTARAAYLCVVAGLIILSIVAIGAVFARIVLTIGGH